MTKNCPVPPCRAASEPCRRYGSTGSIRHAEGVDAVRSAGEGRSECPGNPGKCSRGFRGGQRRGNLKADQAAARRSRSV
jgi:hypothetical protein